MIQIIHTPPTRRRSCPVNRILLNFYGTAVVNIMTWCKIYSVYPYTTFVARQICSLRYFVTESERAAIEKYECRGWRYAKWQPYQELCTVRFMNDDRSWTFEFDLSDNKYMEKEKIWSSMRFVCLDRGVLLVRSLDT